MERRTDVIRAEDLSMLGRYTAWRATPHGYEVFQLCSELAGRLVERGFKHYGCAAIIQTARWHYSIKHGPDAEGYKVNNNYEPYLSREMTERQIVPEGFFRTRKTRA